MDTLVEDHLDLALHIAQRYARRGVDLDDVNRVARLALVTAAHRYDPARGPFAPYAAATVRGQIKRHFRDQAWMVRPPRSIQQLQARLADGDPTLDPHDPQVRESAAATGCFHAAELAESAPQLGCPDCHDDQIEATLGVEQLCRTLPPQDRQLLTLRFWQGLSQREIAALLYVSQMEGSRRLAAVLGRLRQSSPPPDQCSAGPAGR